MSAPLQIGEQATETCFFHLRDKKTPGLGCLQQEKPLTVFPPVLTGCQYTVGLRLCGSIKVLPIKTTESHIFPFTINTGSHSRSRRKLKSFLYGNFSLLLSEPARRTVYHKKTSHCGKMHKWRHFHLYVHVGTVFCYFLKKT